MTRSMMSTDELWRMFQEGELERHRLAALNRELVEALADILPLAEAYLKGAPTHPDNAKLETARAVLAKAKS